MTATGRTDTLTAVVLRLRNLQVCVCVLLAMCEIVSRLTSKVSWFAYLLFCHPITVINHMAVKCGQLANLVFTC